MRWLFSDPPPCRSPAYTKQVNHRWRSLPLPLAAAFSVRHSHVEKQPSAGNQRTPPVRKRGECGGTEKRQKYAAKVLSGLLV